MVIQSIAGVSTFTENVRIVKSSGPLLELTTNTGAADATLRLSEGATGSTTNGGGMYYSGADNKLHITCGTNSTTKRITINRDDGKVGINSTSPTYALEVDGGTQNTVIAVRSSDAKAAISFLDSTSNGYGRATIGGEGDEVYITSGGGAERIRFGTGGNSVTTGISTTLNLVTNSEVLSVRGYSSFKSTSANYAAIYTHNEGNTSGTYNTHILWNANGANRGGIGYMPNNGEVIINNQNALIFATGGTHFSGTERLKIYSGGQIGIRNTNATSFNTGGDDLVIGNATDGQDAGITLYSHSSDNGSIFFNDTADTGLTGLIQYRHSEDAMRFSTNTLERLRITSAGLLLLGTTDTGFSTGYTNMTIGNTSTTNTGLTIASASNGYSRLHFADGNSSSARYAGWIAYNHNDDQLLMSTANSGSSKISLDSNGTLNIGSAAPTFTTPTPGLNIEKTSTGSGPVISLYNGQSANAASTCDILVRQNYRDSNKIIFGRENANNWQASASSVGSFTAFHTNDGTGIAEKLRIESNGDVAINTTDGDFGQTNGASNFAKGDPKLGVHGSIGIMNTSGTTTDYSQLAFYRRTTAETQGNGSHRITSTSNLGRISWNGSSNDTSFPDEVCVIQAVANGGDWWSGSNRRASLQFHNNNVGEMARFDSSGVFSGRPIMNRNTSGVSGGGWTTHGAWKVLVDLNVHPSNALYMCDAAMQNLSAYTATFWVYKSDNAHYCIVYEETSLCSFRLNGTQIEIRQNSGADQTTTSGYQKVFCALGMNTPKS
jgi:hypothetical protein